MDAPPDPIWPKRSATRKPNPPGSGEPAHPVLHLIYAIAIIGPCLIALAVLAIHNIDFKDVDAIDVPLLVLVAGIWVLILLAAVKTVRRALRAIRERKRN